jgi:VCBS repeat-containing protein
VANDSDADSDTISPNLVTQPSHGTAAVSAGQISYTPGSGYFGPDSFTYQADDGILQSSPVTVSITVDALPVANGDTYLAVSGIPRPVAAPGVLANDTDADTDSADLTASKLTDPTHGAVTVATDGSFTYTASSGYRGADSFTYDVSDGVTESEGTVSLTVMTPNDAFVHQVYADELHRSADGSGAVYWMNELDDAHLPKATFVRDVLGSLEFRMATVNGLYQSVLGRPGDAPSVAYWSDRLAHGLTVASLEAQLTGSAEYYGQHGGSASTYVDAIYPLLLGRTVDAPSKAFWISQLAHGTSRTTVARQVLASVEGLRRAATSLYQTLLDRAPTTDEQNAAVTSFKSGNPYALVSSLASTADYQARANADAIVP